MSMALMLSNVSLATSPTVDQIVDKTLEWIATENERDVKYTYRRVAHVEKLDSDGKVEERENRVYKAILIDGRNYERLVMKNGAPLSGDDLEEEQEKEKKFRTRPKGKKDEGEIVLDREMAARYKFRLKGKEEVGGRSAYVLSFAPDRNKKLPDKKKEDAVLNALAGKIWVDEQEYAIARIDARLTRTVRVGLGLIAFIKKARLRFETRRTGEGEWLPHSMRSFFWGRTFLFKPIRRRETSRFVDFKVE
jgi:hypothetical protein